MLALFINIFTFLGLTRPVIFIFEGLSKFYSHDYTFFYTKPFWAVRNNSMVYIDYIIDPRIGAIEEACKLYRDIFYYNYQIKPKDIVVDVGAGLGHEALVFNEELENSGKIFLIEATPSTFQGLKQTVELNNFKNCNCFNYAISDMDEGYLQISNSTDGHLSRSIINSKKEKNLVKIKQITMDSFIEEQGINEIDLLIINIEGFESNLIKNFSKIRQVRNIVVSCHDFLYHRQPSDMNLTFLTSDSIKEFLNNNGFEVKERNTGIDYKDSYVYGSRI